MFCSYNICTNSDERIFKKQCSALEKYIPNIVKGKLLEDIDGSKTQFYYKNGKEIFVKNSYYIGAVYIESDIESTNFLNKLKQIIKVVSTD